MQNENLVAQEEDAVQDGGPPEHPVRVLASVPDLICCVESESEHRRRCATPVPFTALHGGCFWTSGCFSSLPLRDSSVMPTPACPAQMASPSPRRKCGMV